MASSIANTVIRAVVTETTRQLGQGIREWIRNQRKEGAKAKPKPDLEEARKALMNLGYKKSQVDAILASPEIQAMAGRPVADQVRAALKILNL